MNIAHHLGLCLVTSCMTLYHNSSYFNRHTCMTYEVSNAVTVLMHPFFHLMFFPLLVMHYGDDRGDPSCLSNKPQCTHIFKTHDRP